MGSYLEMLDALTDAIGSSEDQSLEEVKEELKAEGIDVEASIERLMETVRQCSKAARRQALERAKEERLKAEARIPGIVKKFAHWTREQMIEKIKEIISNEPETAISLSFRDLESRTDEDLASLLEDLEVARFADEESKDGP